MRVYHFLPAEWALADIALRRLKVARLHELNDPFEFYALNVGGRKAFRTALAETKNELAETKGLICFSKDWRNPVMWSHYAGRHHGICLGFDFEEGIAKDISYVDERIAFPLDDLNSTAFDEEAMEKLLYTKFQHWAYEEEVRAYVDLDPSEKEDGIFYYPFDERLRLREVILGPLCAIPIERIKALVYGYSEKVFVIKSRLAFKFFKVVRDERY